MLPFSKPSGDTVVMFLLGMLGIVLLWVGWTGRSGDVLAAIFAPSALASTTQPTA